MSKYQTAVRVSIVLFICFNVISILFTQRTKYTSHVFWQHFSTLKQAYLDSQYVNKHPKGWIPDEVVNSYAGGAYMRGVSPILIAPDTPPLGRYIIGVSESLFNNENILNFFFFIGSLFMLFLLGAQIFKNKTWALLAPLFVTCEPLLRNQLIFTPLLDIMQLFFLLSGFYLFNKAIVREKSVGYFILASFFLGCFITTKFYVTGATIVIAWGVTLILLKEFRKLLQMILTLPVAVGILLLSYVRVLFDHYSLFKFLGIQKYVLLYHKSQLIYPFSIWDLLLFNRWHVWFGNKPVIQDNQWIITWPITTIGALVTGFLALIKQIKLPPPVLPLLLWVIAYLLFFSFGQIASRYFIILLPILYLVTLFGGEQLYLRFHKKQK